MLLRSKRYELETMRDAFCVAHTDKEIPLVFYYDDEGITKAKIEELKRNINEPDFEAKLNAFCEQYEDCLIDEELAQASE